jgi:hypothetical protein
MLRKVNLLSPELEFKPCVLALELQMRCFANARETKICGHLWAGHPNCSDYFNADYKMGRSLAFGVNTQVRYHHEGGVLIVVE